VISRDTAYATIVVQLADQNETVYFRVYSYSTDTIYDSMLSVEPDFGEEIGSDTPISIDAGLITTLATPVVALQQEGSSLQLHGYRFCMLKVMRYGIAIPPMEISNIWIMPPARASP
jgi:hypothetical protein